MSLILNIDTALSIASVSLCESGVLLGVSVNENDRDHAAWIHGAIDRIMKENGKDLAELKAVAVSHGPGSYTGLRIGLSTAKGLCYALKIPLITIPTLEIMAIAAVENFPRLEELKIDLVIPMIDARRMEIYFAIYDRELTLIEPPSAIILDQYDFNKWLNERKILFFGNGTNKFRNKKDYTNGFYLDFEFIGAVYMKKKSLHYYDNKWFADLSLSEPLYIKEFHDTSSK